MATRPSLRTDSPRAVPTDDLACVRLECGWCCTLLHPSRTCTCSACHVMLLLCMVYNAHCVCHIYCDWKIVALDIIYPPEGYRRPRGRGTRAASRAAAQGACALVITRSLQCKRSSKRAGCDRSLTSEPWIRSALATAARTRWTRMLTPPIGPSTLALAQPPFAWSCWCCATCAALSKAEP